MAFVIWDTNFEGWKSELVQVLASETADILVLSELQEGQRPDVVVFRPENQWALDSLSSARCRREGRADFLDLIPESIWESIRRKDCKLVFDVSREATPLDYLTMLDLHERLARRIIPTEMVFYVTPNGEFKKQYAGFTYSNPQFAPINISFFNYYVYMPAKLFSNFLTPDFDVVADRFRARLEDEGPPNEFMCLNFAPRAHRAYLLILLRRLGLEKHGLISISNLRNNPNSITPEETLAQIHGSFRVDDMVNGDFKQLVESSPVEVDMKTADAVESSSLLLELPSGPAMSSAYTVTTETIYLAPLYEFTTEKTLKPFALFHPSIILGNAHRLPILRELGFRTFNPHIDESYDEIEDNDKRINAVVNEIRRIHDMGAEKRSEWSLSMWPTVLFNARHLAFTLPELLQARWRDPLLREIGYPVDGRP